MTSGNKKVEIFDAAIELFAEFGYENVSVRDIAKKCKIKSSSIYNHFSSKQKILDDIYAYFIEHYHDNRRSVSEMKSFLETASKEEFVKSLMFTFESPDQFKWKRMVLTVKIIYMRIFQDEQARNIFLNQLNRDEEIYAREILEYGIDAGILGEFDIQTYMDFLIGQRHIMGIKAYANPGYFVQQLEEEQRIFKMSADLLPYVKTGK